MSLQKCQFRKTSIKNTHHIFQQIFFLWHYSLLGVCWEHPLAIDQYKLGAYTPVVDTVDDFCWGQPAVGPFVMSFIKR